MNKDTPISACIITKNEQDRLPVCLNSLKWVPEIIVVDDYSSDSTVAICRSYPNVRCVQHRFLGFGCQKNFAALLANSEWILSVDADEEVTPELAAEISLAVSGHSHYLGFRVRRKNLCFGKCFVDDYPGVVRLFRKISGKFSEANVHEKVLVDGEVGQLHALLLHKSKAFESFRSHYATYAVKYGYLAARDYFDRGKRINCLNFCWRIIFVPLLVFGREFVLKRKYRMGKAGMYMAICSAACYHKAYWYLMGLQKGKR